MIPAYSSTALQDAIREAARLPCQPVTANPVLIPPLNFFDALVRIEAQGCYPWLMARQTAKNAGLMFYRSGWAIYWRHKPTVQEKLL